MRFGFLCVSSPVLVMVVMEGDEVAQDSERWSGCSLIPVGGPGQVAKIAHAETSPHRDGESSGTAASLPL